MKVWMPAILGSALFVASATAQAEYDFQLVEYPGAPNTLVHSINARGEIAGTTPDLTLPFVYDSKTGTITDIAPLAGFDATFVRSINDAGTMTGTAGLSGEIGKGFILDKDGNFTVFSHPDAVAIQEGMDINNKGLVTGIRGRLAPFGLTFSAYVYNPRKTLLRI